MTFYPPIVASMKMDRRRLPVAMLGLAAVFLAGCGGVSASRSVSPASFFVPGLMKNDLPRQEAPGTPTPTLQKPAPRTLPS